MDKKPQGPIYFNLLHTHKQWESEIAPLLEELARGDQSSEKIIKTLILFNEKYCWRRGSLFKGRFKGNCEYNALKSLYDKKLPEICKQFSRALLQLKPDKIPMVMGQANTRLNYKKKDFVYLLLLMFFSLVPKQYSDCGEYLQKRFHDENNFAHILQRSLFKTQCIVEYLLIAVTELKEQKEDQLLTIVRRVQPKNKLQETIFVNQQKHMTKLVLQSNDKSIQQYNGEIKIDFANRFIGGGCLADGCVQQQIMFAVRPELYATTLLCQKMEDNEALAFIGFKRYFDHSGYGNTTKFQGPAKVEYKRSKDYQAEEYIAAIDAIKFKVRGQEQFQRQAIDRQIMKAYLGFSALEVEGRIVTGGWGCGVYHGDIQAKILIQWIAATLAGRQVVFCPFGKKNLLEQSYLLQRLKERNVLEVYRLLLDACEKKLHSKNSTLFNLASEMAPKM